MHYWNQHHLSHPMYSGNVGHIALFCAIALIRYGQLNNKITNHNVIPANQASPYLFYNDVRPVSTSLARNVVITAPDRRDELRK